MPSARVALDPRHDVVRHVLVWISAQSLEPPLICVASLRGQRKGWRFAPHSV